MNTDLAATLKAVSLRLPDREFRRRLTVTAPDGTSPIVVALREDSVGDLLSRLECAGGLANVVVPTADGFVVVAARTTTT